MLTLSRSLLVVLSLAALSACGDEGQGGGADTTPRSDGVVFGDGGGSATTTSPVDTTQPGCTGDGDCGGATPHCSPGGVCVACLTELDCGAGDRCTNGACVPATCTPDERRCEGTNAMTCRADGASWDTIPCGEGACVDGRCAGCTPDARVCQGDTVLACRADGSGYDTVGACPSGQLCRDGACFGCQPSSRRCAAAGHVEVCDAEGRWQLSEDCAADGLSCLSGTCVSPCVTDLKTKSNSGCDYWAADLDNHYDAQNGPYAIIVSNLSDQPATVMVSRKDGPQATTAEVMRRDVAPGSLAKLNLPQRNMASAGVFWSAYRIESSRPIIAYQFNPLDNVDVFSNDASLLLPANTYGTEYIVVSRNELVGGGPNGTSIPYRGSISVLATVPGTNVTVVPTARTQAGANMATMQAGQSYTYTLEPYQVLNIKSDQAPVGASKGGDLTGTIITSTKPVAVFGGHEAAVSSTSCCADHLEQQMFPVHTWGREYVASKSFKRLDEKDYWRVVASQDGTTVTFSPAVSAPVTLARGQSVEIVTDQDFFIEASAPIMVAQLLASSSEIVQPPAYGQCNSASDCYATYQCLVTNGFGTKQCIPRSCTGPNDNAGCLPGHACSCFASGNCLCAPTGDPALILIPPTGQFREDYVFLTPDKYVDDYVNIVAPVGATVRVDGNTLPQGNFTTVPGSSWMVARLKVPDGVHTITSPQKVGVIAYGYDRDVSYGYPAGLNLTDL